MDKILIICGHGAGDPGACSKFGTEAIETRRIGQVVKTKLEEYEAKVDIYPIDRNAYSDIGSGLLKVDFSNYDYVFEMHFNSVANETAAGVEIWVSKTENSTAIEQKIVNNVTKLGFSNRGVKKEDFRVIRTAKSKGALASLIEICFISNESDMHRYTTNFNSVCNAIVEGLEEGLDLKKKVNPTAPNPQPNNKVSYYVRTINGKQLGAFNNLEYAVAMASKNGAAVYDVNNKIIRSYIVAKQYLNLKPHMSKWNVYPTNAVPVNGNECGSLSPKAYGGLSYEILGNPLKDVYTIGTTFYKKVNIYAPRDNDSSITNNPIY